jgi:uncharacterized Zn-finger protein
MQDTKNIQYTHQRSVYCDGLEDGHPGVYLAISHTEITCPYCSKIFCYVEPND